MFYCVNLKHRFVHIHLTKCSQENTSVHHCTVHVSTCKPNKETKSSLQVT